MAIDIDSGVELRLKLKADRELNYKVKTTVDQKVTQGDLIVNQQKTTVAARLRQQVLKVEEDGSAHLINITLPEEPGGPIERQVVYQKVKSNGEVLDASGVNPTNAYSFPDQPVKPGTSWEGQVKLTIPTRPEPIICKSIYTVEGLEEMLGHECVKIMVESEEIEFEVPVPEGGMAKVVMGSSGVMHFAPEEGVLVRMELETDSTPTIGQMVFNTSNIIVQELEKSK